MNTDFKRLQDGWWKCKAEEEEPAENGRELVPKIECTKSSVRQIERKASNVTIGGETLKYQELHKFIVTHMSGLDFDNPQQQRII